MVTMMYDFDYVRKNVRQVPDFPKPGILFLDITTATKDAKSFQISLDFLYDQFKNEKVDYVAGIESRGFIFGAALAYELGIGFVPLRKPGKLPGETLSQDYALEYGTDTLQIHKDAIESGKRVVIIDDLLATGGTAGAACNLIKQTGAKVVAAAFVIELQDLNGRAKMPEDVEVVSMLVY